MELSPEQIYPKVGIAVMVIKGNKILLGKRKGSHGEGVYAFPGGSLEYMESIEDCIVREVMEETGMTVKGIEFIRAYNLREYAPKHFLDLAFFCEWESGEPEVMEPDKCEGWGWYGINELPSPLFATINEILVSYWTHRHYVAGG